MNKQELEAKLHNYEERLKDVAKAIEETRKQLAEAEKPELRHGDFGINKNDLPWLAVKTMTGKIKVEVFWYNSACPSGLENDDFVDSRLGNIFDLMKDWGEDLKGFLIRSNRFRIDFENAMYPFKIADSWFTLPEAEEICCKLPQMIMTLKRNKQGD